MSRFHFFPVPEIRETAYSVFCRCATRSGLQSTHVLSYLSGQPRHQPLLADVPGHISYISSKIPEGHPWVDPKSLLTQNSLFAYYTYFDSVETRTALIERCLSSQQLHRLELALGISKHKILSASRHPRICPLCISEDKERVGFAYFHVEHQLPGVLVCWKHETALADGCAICGRYPLVGRPLGMAGSCHCDGRLLKSPRHVQVIGSTEPLVWIAKESAQMSAFSGSAGRSLLQVRELLIAKGFGNRSLPKFTHLADAMIARFGQSLLEFMGYPPRSGKEINPWLKRSLARSRYDIRRHPLIYLLLLGAASSSLDELDAFSRSASDHSVAKNDAHSIKPMNSNRPIASWRTQLSDALNRASTMNAASTLLNVSLSALAAEARAQHIRVPLSARTIRKLGASRVTLIKEQLSHGLPKAEIMLHFGISEWSLTRIELDDPECSQQWAHSQRENLRRFHRDRVSTLIRCNPATRRSDVMRLLPGTYDYVIANDKEWFQSEIARAYHQSRRPRLLKKHIQERDSEMAKVIRDFVRKELHAEGRPVRISATRALRSTGRILRYARSPSLFPRTTKAISEGSETVHEFRERKIGSSRNRVGGI